MTTMEEEKALQDLADAQAEEVKAEKRQKIITPGPGAFNLPSVFGGKDVGEPHPTVPKPPAFAVPKSPRDMDVPSVHSDVGPGTYDPNQSRRPRGVVIGTERRDLSNSRKFPSPASALKHRDNYRYSNLPRYGFGYSDRTKFGLFDKRADRGCKMPGPGNHDPSDTVTSRTGPCYSFGAREAHKSAKEVEKAEPKVPKSPKYVRSNTQNFSEGIRHGNALHHGTWGTATRLANWKEKAKPTPGPGAYGEVTASVTSPVWTMGRRPPDHKLDHATI